MALAYLFCVLAPSLSFAFADGEMQAPCIVEDHGPAMGVHGSMPHHHAGVAHGDVVPLHDHGMPVADATGLVHHEKSPANTPRKHTDRGCCGLVSISALPAAEIVVAKPELLTSRCEVECFPAIADNAPPGLYRPPIA